MPAPSFIPPRPSNWPKAAGEQPQLVLEAGKVIANKYVLERHAGFGGMSQLWVATNKATCAEVCVKLLVPEGDKPDADEESIERFRREAHAAARLSHRAIVRVFDLLELDANGEVISGPPSSARASVSGKKPGSETSARPYAYAIVMELLRGETLGDLLAKRGKLPVEEALDLFLPVISALAHAHRASVIHRDVKPDNIFLAVDPDGQVIPKVLDFGVSKLSNADAITIDGVVVGTPSFMSPEQAKGARVVDARSDVFSAGILFYMMIAGKNPFEDTSFATVIEAVMRREVPALAELASSPEVWTVLHRALEKDPAARWNDATEMGIALRKAAGRKSNTDSNPIMPLEPLSQRTLDRQSGLHDRGPGSGSGSGSGAASGPRSGVTGPQPLPQQQDSNFSIPPTGSDSLPPRWLHVGNRRRNLVFGVLGCAAVILVAALVVRVVSPSPSSSSSAAAQPTNTVVAAVATQPPPPASITSAAVPPQPSSSLSSPVPSSNTPIASPNPTTTTKSSGASTGTKRPGTGPSRRPGDQNIAREPGF